MSVPPLIDRGGMTYRLASHQLRILQKMDECGSLGIFAEAGTGKTMIALTWIYDSLISGSIDDALVICPHSLIASWESAISKMAEFGYSEDEIDIVRGAVSIVSYNSVWVRNKDFRKKKGQRKYEIRQQYKKQWGAIFCDESHRLGDPYSVQTTVILRMIPLAEHRFPMTGTPDSGKYTKLYGQLKFIDPSLFEDYRQFERRYVLAKDYFGNPTRYDEDALDSLKRRYGAVARLKECFDMPDSTETDVPVPFTAEGLRAYKDMLGKRRKEYGINFQTAGVSSMKAKQCCSGFVFDDDHVPRYLPTGKIEALEDIIESRDGKIVVFCQYIPSIDRICDFLGRKKISYVRFDASEKRPVWEDFQSDPNIRMIVVQYQRGAEGIDLFSADCMVFYETTPSPYILEQAKARIMRKGQVKKCSYYYLYTPHNSLEERSMRSVRAGMDVSRLKMDKWADEERERYSIEAPSDAVE